MTTTPQNTIDMKSKFTKPKLTAHQEFMRQRDALLPKLIAFEKEHGAKLARSAMQKHMTTQRARERHQSEIRSLQKKLAELENK